MTGSNGEHSWQAATVLADQDYRRTRRRILYADVIIV